MATATDHAEALARELRRRLGEHRRTEAAAGRRHERDLPAAVTELVAQEAAVLSPARRELLCELIMRETVGLGPLEELLADPAVEEVMVNGHREVYVERAGRIEHSDVRFPSDQALRDAIERVLAPLGRRVDELSPMVDARLADGSRVNVVMALPSPFAASPPRAPIRTPSSRPARSPRRSATCSTKRWALAGASW